jgi:Tfp pilus assembly protein PilV
MLKVWSVTKSQQGFSVVEALLAVAVFGFLVTGLIGAIVYGRVSSADAGDHSRATFLAEEGIEATRNIATASYANLVDNTAATVGDTTIEASFDNNANGTSAYKVTTGATGGVVASVSVYIKAVDATNKHVQAAIYADSSGTPGAQLAQSAIQIATATSWNTFPMSGVTVSPTTNYWIGLSEDGSTQFASGSGGVTAYRVTSGYPAPNPFAANAAPSTGKLSFYMSIASGSYGLAQVSNQWAFSGTSDVSGIYTRQITVSPSGTNRKMITSTVSWPQSGGTTGSTTLTTQLVNWAAATKLWSNAIVAGATDVTGTNNAVKTDTVGNYAYTVLSATTNNLVITNIATPATPTNTSTITLAGTPTNIYVAGNYAYITNTSDTAELQVVDISNPALPVLKASVDMIGTGDGLGVFVSGTNAYVTRASDATTNANEFTVVNIATPISPAVMGGYNNNIAMNDVYVSGNYAYVATSSTTAEMLVINVTTPATPTLAATYNPATALAALTVTGFGSTVLLGMSTTLDAINVATPTAPVRLGVFTAAGTINDVDVDITNKFAFLGTASTTGEFQAVNIATPATMTLAKTVDVTGTTSTVAGVSYNTSLDAVVGATASDTQEVAVFTRN